MEVGNGEAKAVATEVTSEGAEEQPVLPEHATPAPAEDAKISQEPTETERRYTASVFPGPKGEIPLPLGLALGQLESVLGMPVWLVLQDHSDPHPHIDDMVCDLLLLEWSKLEGPVALVIDSHGGYARCSYQIAKALQRRGGFVAVVPRRALSAATLLAIGATEIYMARDAELGPLDAQVFDPERETAGSALDEVQALERLYASAMDAVDRNMFLLTSRMKGKKTDSLLSMSMHFVAEMMRPLFEKIDTVHYTQQSRVLKEAEEYAARLLSQRYDDDRAEMIARRLVHQYPEHGFVIDAEEASGFGLAIAQLSAEKSEAVDQVGEMLRREGVCAIGRLKEVSSDQT